MIHKREGEDRKEGIVSLSLSLSLCYEALLAKINTENFSLDTQL
jgi:hypothetical protein